MITFQHELEIDFGNVGDRFGKEPFKVRLDATPLSQLISDASNAYRVCELMLITRLGDVWDYVLVDPIALPRAKQESIDRLRTENRREPIHADRWSDDKIPFNTFDQQFYWLWDDDESADIAWRRARELSGMVGFARQLWRMVVASQNGLKGSDPLLGHIHGLIQSRTHPFDRLSREAAINRSTRTSRVVRVTTHARLASTSSLADC